MAAARPPVRSAPKSSGRQAVPIPKADRRLLRQPGTGGEAGGKKEATRNEHDDRFPDPCVSRKPQEAKISRAHQVERERRASRTPRQQALFGRRHSNGERALYHEGVLLRSVTQTVYRRGRVTPSAICAAAPTPWLTASTGRGGHV